MDLKSALLRERLDLYVRLRGGISFPIAGAIWWGAFAVLGASLPVKQWALWAFVASGLIFPIAIVVSRIMRIDFFNEKSSVDDVLVPAFIGMLLFWPMAFAAFWSAVEMTPLILAIGMAMHWPTIGWSYGRTAIYSAHAIVRAVAALVLWVLFPDQRTVLVPASVSVVYLLTVAVIVTDLRRLKASDATLGRGTPPATAR
jgi:hypothetical protein